MTALRKLAILLLVIAVGPLVGSAKADPVQETMKSWLAANANQGTIPPGTTITMQNWQQYQQYMPVGMIEFFKGTYFWKMPPDVSMPVGPTVILPLPKDYIAASEKYGSQTQVVHTPDGHMNVANYVAGMPFPNPSDPDKGYKILANVWFPGGPYLAVLSTDSGLASFCTADRFNNSACTRTSVVYRQLAYNWAPGVARTDPQASGAWFSEWLMVEQPEQSRYTADLTLFSQDLSKSEDSFVFVPSLRRSLRLSTSARCAPLFGSDMVHDDQRVGYNGGLSAFNAEYLGTRKILGLTDLTNADGAWPANYDMPLGWSKPSWGPWSLREVDVIDVRRVPSEQAGYCYGSKIMYVDHEFYHQLFEEIYDANMKLWKVVQIGLQPATLVAGEEPAPYGGGIIETYWDLQNDHVSHVFTANADGKTDGLRFDQNVAPEYNNISRYSTPSGLMQIMR
ncbi:MAG: DUF1329 domain-containing protein [Candidatus Binataceae bacterium]|nr:DUF1329 domain-containing protein [Candidatus Binataceae bacterium]